MKQRVITAVCLLAVLAVVVWQINTPILLIAVAFLSAVASDEIMKCAKVENRRRAEYCLHHCSLPCIFPCNA